MTALTADAINKLSDQEVADLNRQLKKKLIRNVLIFAGVKVATVLAINYMIKSATKAN